MTLSAGAAILGYGGSTTLTGKVSSGDANDSVVITSNPFGAAAQQTATVTTGAGGDFSYAVNPSIQTTYTATWKGTKSQSVTILVRPKMMLTRITRTRLFTKVRSSISYSGRYAFLQRRTSVGWITVKRLYLGLGRAGSSRRRARAARARTAST